MSIKQKKALIAGITGQDGSHLSELLLEKGYMVHGIIRRSSSFNTGRIDHLMSNPNFKLHYGDVTDPLNISQLVSQIQPDEIYNLAAQSHVKVSFEEPYYTGQVDALGTLSFLETIKNHSPHTKFYQASTSELYGGMTYNRPENGYNENSPFHPRSPYGVAKLYGFWIVKNYRESYNLFAVNGILFNHEGERRGKTFVTRKITTCLSEIKYGLRKTLKLGNLNSLRDWGYAKDFVEGMWLMLQQEKPEDFVLATGQIVSVKEFVEKAAKYIGYDIIWQGEGLEEKGYDRNTGSLIVEVDPQYFRPAEVDLLLGDASKAKEVLGWVPKTNIDELVKIMMDKDLSEAKEQSFIREKQK